MTTVYIGLGSNLGDRQQHLETAKRSLDALPETRLLRTSEAHETDPVGQEDQGAFLNAVAELDTRLGPWMLLEQLRRIERESGRQRHTETRWGPRTLDLDLLLYGDRVIDHAGLTVPHPRMMERRFVLGPLVELAPEAVHPKLKRTAKELLEALDQGKPFRPEESGEVNQDTATSATGSENGG
jgi:2-amino-4-hydroxy-6-hydroxymethyldihydropteridine diphosphokinase